MSAPPRRPHVLALLAIAGLAVGLYAGTLRFPFALDDLRNIARNPAIRMQEVGWEALRRAAFESPTPRSVANVSFALDYRLWGLDVRGYRAVNIAVHALCGALVYALALTTYRRAAALGALPRRLAGAGVQRRVALFAALVFVAHPLQTQSVTYVVQRMNSLATAGALLALLLWLRGGESRAGRRLAWRAGAAGAWLLALGSKETAVVLPLLLWFYDGYFQRDLDARWRRRTPWVLLGAVAGLALLCVAHPEGLQGYAGRDFTPGQRLLTQLRVLWIYVGLVLLPLPSHLNLLHDVPLSRALLDPPTTALALAGLLALVVFAAAAARRQRLLSFAIVWFLLGLVLESSALPLAMLYEHRTHLPLVGVALAAPALVHAAVAARPAAALCSVGVALLALGTLARNPVWRTNATLWSDVVAKSPGSARAHDELGLALAAEGRLREALVHHREAVRLDPIHPARWVHLGNALVHAGAVEEGLEALREALRLDPDDASAHQALGLVSLELGRPDAAAFHLERSAALAPDDAAVHVNLARLLAQDGRAEAARRELERALELDPDSLHALNNLAWLLATGPDPGRDVQRALELAGRARALHGDDPDLLDTLAAAQAAAGLFPEAQRTAAAAAAGAERAGRPEAAAAIRARAALYREGRPYREPPPR
jgi:Flp pilus assembly protein TadD